jgi:HlyD family secretion protein
VISAEASLKEANENLQKTSIYAPMTGTVSMLLVERGERVVGTSMMTGTEMMRVADLSRMEAQVQVNENDIVKVKLGDTTLIEVDAYLDQKFKGVVTEIANSAKTTGVSADQIPIQSVTTRTDSTKVISTNTDKDIRTIVFIVDGVYARAKDVKTGIQDNSYIEILSGVSVGERVISAPFSAISKKLSDSTIIEVVKKEVLFKVK